jgi:cysteine-rich repeat protein
VASACGNGALDAGEECDDGNTTAGDGCSPTCQNETVDLPADLDDDGDVDLDDHAIFMSMFLGPQ